MATQLTRAPRGRGVALRRRQAALEAKQRRIEQGGFSAGEANLMFGLLLVGLLFPFPLGASLLLSQVAVAIVIVYWFLGSLLFARSGLTPRERALLLLLLVLGGACVMAVWFFGRSDRFDSEAIKVGLLVAGALAISAIARERIWTFLPLAGFASTIAILYSWFVTTDRFAYGGRLQLDDFGSPNTLGLIIALTILMLALSHYGTDVPPLVRPLRWPLIAVLAWLLFQTTSRGGIFALAAGLVVGVLFRRSGAALKSRWTGALGIVVAALGAFYVVTASGTGGALLSRLNLGADNSSSGRTQIWTELLTRQFDDTRAILVGFGPGSVDLAFLNKTVVSAHSLILTMFVYFGLAGLLGFLGMLLMTWRRALRVSDVHASLRIGLLAALTLSFVVDNVALSTQGLLVMALALAATGVTPAASEGSAQPPAERRQGHLRGRALGVRAKR